MITHIISSDYFTFWNHKNKLFKFNRIDLEITPV